MKIEMDAKTFLSLVCLVWFLLGTGSDGVGKVVALLVLRYFMK